MFTQYFNDNFWFRVSAMITDNNASDKNQRFYACINNFEGAWIFLWHLTEIDMSKRRCIEGECFGVHKHS